LKVLCRSRACCATPPLSVVPRDRRRSATTLGTP